MKLTNLTALGYANGAVVLDAQGQMRRLEPGEQPGPGDLVVDLGEGAAGETDISAQLIGEQLQPTDVAIDDVIAQLVDQIEQGVDPTQQGEDFATAAGGQNGSSLTGSGDIERTGAESQASTEFETEGLESQGLSETQSLALIQVVAQALVSGISFINEDETNAPIVTGGLLETDVEGVDFVPVTDEAGDNGFGVFSIDADGNWTFTADDAYDELAVGDSNTDTITVITTDGTEQVITVTIDGTNDIPIAFDADETTEENTVLVSEVPDGSDVDGTVASYQLVDDVLEGSLVFGADGSFTFDPGTDFDDLSVESERDVTFTYTATDNDGGVSEVKTITITVTGTNDDPILTVDTEGGVTEDDSLVTLSDTGELSFTDVDTTDTHTVSESYNDDVVWSGGSLTDDQKSAITGGFTADSDSWDYSVANADVDFLAQDETVIFTYDVTVTDSSGGSDTETVTITVTGTNDDPILTVDTEGGVTEDDSLVTLSDTGELSFTDVDTTDTHTVSESYNDDVVWSGGSLTDDQKAAITGGFTADSDSWDYSVANADVDFLAQDETVIFTYDVTVTDSSGGSDTETVTITVTGTNDDPILTVDTEGGVTEDDSLVTLSDTGELSFTDVDTTDTHTVSESYNDDVVWSGGSLTDDQKAAITGGFTADSDSWDYSVANADVDFLAQDETVIFTYDVTVTDSSGGSDTETVTITVTGTNDDPILTVDPEGGVTEDDSLVTLSDTGELSFTDVDTTDTHTVSESYNDDVVWSGGSLTDDQKAAITGGFTADSDSWDYSVANADVDFLAQDETVIFTYDVTVTDSSGGSDTETVTITVTGTNDDPILTVDPEGGVTEDDSLVTLSDTGALSFTDVDTTDTHTVSESYNDDVVWSGGSLTDDQKAAITGGFTADSDSWDYSVANADVDFLAQDETVIFTYDVTVTDISGGTDTETVTITVTGTNDDPILTVDTEGGVTEDDSLVTLSDTGALSFTDVDTTDTHTVSESYNDDVVWSGGSLTDDQKAAITGGFTADSDSWDYSVANADVDFLAQDETVIFTYDVTVTDSSGGSDTETVTITVTGTNDDPILTVDTEGGVTEDDSLVTLSDTGELSFTDVDTTDTHTVSESYNDDVVWSGGSLTDDQKAAITGGFTADSDSWDYSVANADVDFLAQDETVIFTYDVTVTDISGGTDTETVTITVTGTNDDPILTVDTEGGVTEDDSLVTLSDTGALSFTDVDTTDTHTVSESYNDDVVWSGGSLTDDQKAAITGGFTADSDSWDYSVANADVDFLAQDETVIFTYDVTVTDSSGGSDTETVTITVSGTNDDPILTVDTEGGVTEDDSPVTLSDTGALSFTDVDTTDTHTVSAAYNDDVVWSGGSLTGDEILAITGGFTADSDSWDYSVANADLDFLGQDETVIFTYDVTVTDSSGGTDTETVTITVTGTNDLPIAESFSVDAENKVTVPIIFDSNLEIEDHISDVEDDHNGEQVNVVLTSLPEYGYLIYTDDSGVTRKLTEDDLHTFGDAVTLDKVFDPNNISYVPGAGDTFVLGGKEAEGGIDNWGVIDPDDSTIRNLELSNGTSISMTLTDNNNKPWKLYQSSDNHIGYGVGDSDGNGMNKNESLFIDLSENSLDVVTLGLDGMGKAFNENSNISIEVTYLLASGDTHTELYDRGNGATTDDPYLFEFSYSSPNDEVVGITLESNGGNWVFRYLEGVEQLTEDITFDYQAVDSEFATSVNEATVTIDVTESPAYQVLAAANGDDLEAAVGNDMLIGDDSDNLFTWLDSTLDSGTDVIKDFEVHDGVSGDLIDFNDLLDDPTDLSEVNDLLASIGVDVDGDDVTLTVPIDGSSEGQIIVVEDVVADLSNPLDDLAILSDLIKNDAA